MKPYLALTVLLFGCAAEVSEQRRASWRPPRQEENEWGGANDAPDELSWKTVVAAKDEPGERLVVTGTVFQPDGETPAANVLLYVYHTDATGVYPREGRDRSDANWRSGTLRGWMLTGKDGRYRFDTIRPASYPDTTTPAHIHITVTAPGYDEYWIESYKFADDPYLEEGPHDDFPLGGFPYLLEPTKDEHDVLQASRNIRLKQDQ